MDHSQHFANLFLDEDTLHTPDGDIPLADITRAEFVRDATVGGTGPSSQETSVEAVAGGAVVGGALFGTVGAVAGGLIGSTVKEDVPGRHHIHTNSVTIVFESPGLNYSMDIAREQEVDADRFVKAVRKGIKRHQ